MIKNYFKIAWRNLWRNKIFSSINILGLSIGISASLALFLIVNHEFSFDKFEDNHERIYRVTLEIAHNSVTDRSAAIPAPLGLVAPKEISGLEQTVPLFQFQGDATAKVTIVNENPNNPVVYKKQSDIIFTNSDYFGMLPFNWLAGSPNNSLKDPFTVVLTESRAKQYFPHLSIDNIIGQVITYNDDLKTTVTGIVKDLNENTFFTQLEFISLPTIMQTRLRQNFMMDTWNDWMAYSQLFIKTSKGISSDGMETSLNSLLNKYNKQDGNADFALAFRLQPLNDVHFNYGSVGHRTAHKPTLYGLLAVAVFLLLLGCINFINLTTAQSANRAKEIGIRKTIGSSKKQLVFQFLSETFLITLIASIIAVFATPLILNMFEGFIPPSLRFNLFQQPSLFIFLVLLVLVVSLISGIYPALILSKFRPVHVLKNQVIKSASNDRVWLRKTLTISQFVIAQFFIIATLMVGKQINYSLNKDLGYKKEAIITLTIPRDTLATNANVLLQKVNMIPEISMASLGFMPPAADGPAYTNVTYNNGKEEIHENVQIRWGDTSYLKLYNIKLLAGRNIMQSDTIKEFLINETYMKKMGFQNPEDALGSMLNFNGEMKPVVGVMHDFHQLSLHEAIEPLVFTSFNERNVFLHVALKPQNSKATVWQSALSKLEGAYKEVYPNNDFSYNFFDESIAGFYKSEQNTSRLLKWSTGLAILISCLGLLGLVVYITNVRRKEIGIRKVLGATIVQIVSILSKDFLSLVALAFIIAVPLAFFAVQTWLEDFVYRTPMSWWLFIISGLLMFIMAFCTLAIQTIRTAIANPVKSLRTE